MILRDMRITVWIVVFGLLVSCSKEKKRAEEKSETPARVVNVPPFNSDSAYFFVKRQVEFGPRVPNTKPHRATGDYLIKTLKDFGADITIQEFQSPNYQGEQLALRNIIASFNPGASKRIL